MTDAVPSVAEKVELAINGKLYAGWSSVSIPVSLDDMSGSFSLTLSSKDDAGGAMLAVEPGERCQLKIGGENVIDGWIDAVSSLIDATQHSIQIDGRDKTGDLADCAAVHQSGSWSNVKLEQIASDLAAPFGVKVAANVSTGAAIRKFAIQPGETVAAAIERLLRFRGLIAIASATGDLVITTPDSDPPIATLEIGVNILSARGREDHRERFSHYIVKGQASGDDERSGKTVSQIKGEAKDAAVRRYRPLLIMAEDQSDGASAQVRANFEAGVRAGQSRGADIDVLGWRVSPGGLLWWPNRRVRVKCAPAKIVDEVMLIGGVTFTKGDGGTTVTLSVAPREAWAQLAQEDKA